MKAFLGVESQGFSVTPSASDVKEEVFHHTRSTSVYILVLLFCQGSSGWDQTPNIISKSFLILHLGVLTGLSLAGSVLRRILSS